jgi:hypothetical protein
MSDPPIVITIERAEMARRGRLGAAARLARYGPREATSAARAGFLGRFRTDEERRAYFQELGHKSAEARRARAAAAEAEGGAR